MAHLLLPAGLSPAALAPVSLAHSLADFRHALRDVARRSIHGVDRNPMAVELTKVALWIETVDPGRPLGFFDAQIRCGDALLGVFDLGILQQGIPDAAYKPLTGDDKAVARHYAKKNKGEKSERAHVEEGFRFSRQRDLMRDFAAMRAMPEDTLAQIAAKSKRLKALTKSGSDSWLLSRACDLYVAAFLTPKIVLPTTTGPDGLPRRGVETVPTSGTVLEFLRGVRPFGLLVQNAERALDGARAFHWPLEFPEIMARGGFDVLVGNPPWDIVQVEQGTNTVLQEHLKAYFRQAPYNVLSGRRDLYKLFLCRIPELIGPKGRAGLLVPVGYLVEDDCRSLRDLLWNNGTLEKVIHFQNSKHCYFSRVHASYRFSVTVYETQRTNRHWFSHTISQPSFVVTDEMGRELVGEVFRRYRETGSFGELHDSLENLRLHGRILKDAKFDTTLRFSLAAEWHATTHKKFSVSPSEASARPVGKNRDIHQFNDNFAPASFLVSNHDAQHRETEKNATITSCGDRILIRDIARNDDTVTLIACLSASKLSSYDTPALQIIGLDHDHISEYSARLLLGYLNSRFADFLVRPFVDKHVKGYVLARLPVPIFCPNGSQGERITQVVDQLLEIGAISSNKVIWKNVRGRKLLQLLDEAVAEYLNISKEDRKLVYGQFPHLYAL